jgi:hypothetical protein
MEEADDVLVCDVCVRVCDETTALFSFVRIISSTFSISCNVPRNQPDHVTNPIKFSVIITTLL